MEQEFRAILTGATAVTSLVPAARIAWGGAPQGVGHPYVVLWLIGGQDGAHMNGPNELFEGRVQVDCYGRTYSEASAVAAAIKPVLHFYRGGGFQGVFHAGTRSSREGGTNEAERPYRVSLDFTLAWRDDNG
jgi:hypothetical protein